MLKLHQLWRKYKNALWVHLVLIVITTIVIIPILFMVVKATQDRNTAISPSLLPGGLFWRNISIAWKEYHFSRYMANTVIITTAITIGKTVFSILAAMVLVYFKLPKKNLIFWGILLTLYIPTDLIAIGLFDMISQKNPSVPQFLAWIINPINVFFHPIPFGFAWTNNYNSVIIPFLASATGTFLFTQHFKSIPQSFAEVAYIEGMGPINYLFKILIPISMNTIGALWVIQFISFWNQYFWPRVIIRNNDAQVIQVAIRNLLGVDQVEWGTLMAAALLIVIPPLLVFLILIKQLKNGVALSTEK